MTFIRDTYKASFDSIGAMVEFVENAQAKRKIIIISVLSDYPGSASSKYRAVARSCAEVADYVIFVNENTSKYFRKQNFPDSVQSFEDLEEASDFLSDLLMPGDLVLVKGSKAHHFERFVLARTVKVTCWLMNCGKGDLRCGRCSKLSAAKKA